MEVHHRLVQLLRQLYWPQAAQQKKQAAVAAALVSPTTYPTAYPTATPTKAPTVHPCNDGSRGCDESAAGCWCLLLQCRWQQRLDLRLRKHPLVLCWL
jgi:hypothetical protein